MYINVNIIYKGMENKFLKNDYLKLLLKTLFSTLCI